MIARLIELHGEAESRFGGKAATDVLVNVMSNELTIAGSMGYPTRSSR